MLTNFREIARLIPLKNLRCLFRNLKRLYCLGHGQWSHFAPVTVFLSAVLLRSWLSHWAGFNNDQTTRLLFETNVTKWPLNIVLEASHRTTRPHFGSLKVLHHFGAQISRVTKWGHSG